MVKRVYNFYPGPATLPLPVLEKAREELLNYKGLGMSVMELSHRSKEYDKIQEDASNLVKELMGLPDEYHVLWLQGGASTQFYMAPLNLRIEGKPMEYVNTGAWSKKAIKEAKFYGTVKVVASSEDENFSYIPKDIEFSEDAAYAHITGNNTIYGTEYHNWPDTPDDVPLVCDMSSNLMDKVIDPKNFGVIYAGAQKNLGPAGVTLVIVRDDLLKRVPEETPTMQKWRTHADKRSLFNTPPCWAVYICKLVLEYWKEKGGLKEIEKRNRKKAKILYDVIDNSNGFYKGHAKPNSRSLMNVTFNLETPELEEECVREAEKRDLIGLKGHRSVGGMRASIYNAMTVEGVEKLAEFLKEFQENHE
ncbi:MAG: 3-phosphoserine/phosphohydroxythreonine transaminase [Thermoplasmata archaeon]|nr:MAG: 3-phosphoserine/phosphohydroxythreonine transaminase [Thermoplasmata archaeon]HEC89945.1 3-phosphoserine/phosphohydroxythreonine transaminase [Thermoplasmatales archaeon]